MERVVNILREGLRADDLLVKGRELKGRFAEERVVQVFNLSGGREKHLLNLILFPGRGYYRSWVEVYSVSPEFFGTKLEGALLDLLSEVTDRIFIEYVEDKETVRDLSAGVPPQLSRIGFELAKRGFSWQRDWYYPEGLREGNPKIQAERPLDPSKRLRHLENLRVDLEDFLRRSGEEDLRERVKERFKILQELWKGA